MGIPRRQIWVAAALLLTPSALFAMALLLVGGADGAASAADPRCDSAERAAAIRLHATLDRPDWHSTRALERAVSMLVAARSHCASGWVERGLADYAALDRVLAP
jgi:hypothetical protein